MHFYGWKAGLKTGMYYLRTRPAANAIQFTVDQAALSLDVQKKKELMDAVAALSPQPSPQKPQQNQNEGAVCRMEAGCLMCGS